VQLRTSLLSDVGKVRENNEDSVAEDAMLGALVLADGMGGYQAGEVASRLAVQTILEVLRERAPAAPDFDARCALLRSAVEQANRAIYEAAHKHVQYQGMGTTVVACTTGDDRIAIASVGDSRLYLLRDRKLSQVTRDHSLVQELIDHGHYSKEDAHQLISKNIVTRALGVENRVDVDLRVLEAMTGDVILLCSDGLTDMLDDAAVEEILVHCGENMQAASIQLVSEANARGGRDNVSVILARVQERA
jgi:serine/threonine protein phosphatase PrpC